MSALWAFTGTADEQLERAMTSALAHRAGRDRQVFRSSNATICVALAHDDPRLGGLAVDSSGGMALAAVGRLPKGVVVTDLLAAWLDGGQDALHRARLDCLLLTFDGARMTVTRDIAGVRTAYWGHANGRTFVAVEPKAIAAAPGFTRRIDPGAVAQFLTFSFVPGERCALDGLNEIQAGFNLVIDAATGSTTRRRWFVHEDIAVEEGEPETWTGRMRATIDMAVSEQLPAGEPVGAFLSGGLDSSLVVASASAARRESGDGPPSTFSLHFGKHLPNELDWSQAVADHCQTDHHVLEVSPAQLAPTLRRMVWHLDEPIGDPVTAGNFALAGFARQHTRWVLNGEGGDPLFGGPKNLPMLLAHWYPTMRGPFAREEQYLATWRRAGEEVFTLLHPDYRRLIDRERDLIDVIRPYFSGPRPTHFLNKLMVANMRLKGAHLILPKVDRMLGSERLTPLSPLFNPTVLQLSLRIPPRAKLRDGVEKWILKAAYADMLPTSVVNRPKSGMRVPVQAWFQGELRGMAQDLLSPKAIKRAGVFDPGRVRDVLSYKTGRDGLRLWMLMTFELWRRFAIDGERP